MSLVKQGAVLILDPSHSPLHSDRSPFSVSYLTPLCTPRCLMCANSSFPIAATGSRYLFLPPPLPPLHFPTPFCLLFLVSPHHTHDVNYTTTNMTTTTTTINNKSTTTPPPSPPPQLQHTTTPQPSLLKRTAFAARDPEAAYFRAHLLLWLASMAVLVADRFVWNLWPRQEVLPSVGGSCDDGAHHSGDGGCGWDFFCKTDEVRVLSHIGYPPQGHFPPNPT